MKDIVILTHGDFGSEIIKSAEMIVGDINNIQSFSLHPHQDLASFIEDIRNVLNSVNKDTIYIVDLYGGTPFHAAAFLVKSYGGALVTGLNLPLLIEITSMIETDIFDLNEIVNRLKHSIQIVHGL